MSRTRLLRAVTGALGLAVLLGGLALPLVALALDEGRTPFCCSWGRCCCADAAGGADERPCLRRGCGCERGDVVVAGAPLGFDAELPATSRPERPAPRSREGTAAPGSPLARPHAPPVPPPRRLPA